jgi:hypothetical protein
MAGMKPGKSNNPLANPKQAEALGKPVKFVGTAGTQFACPECNRSLKRGMIYEHAGRLACSKNCIAVISAAA